MQQKHTHKAVTGRVETKNLLSRRRQSEYSKSLFLPNLLLIRKKSAILRKFYDVLISNWRTTWPTEISTPFLSFSDNLFQDVYIISQKSCW